MRAFVITKYKQPLQEADVPEPRVGEHDVLVRVEAAGLNPLDEKIRAGEFKQILPYKLPLILGNDIAGTVIRVGTGVRGFKSGDEVYARPGKDRIGTFAERIAVAEGDLALKPASISMAEAGSLPLVALTAWQALVERGRVQPGQKVLIHAGAGGVGSIAIQLAAHLGASVATTASGASAHFVRALGADTVIDYRTQDFEQLLSGYDLVLDSLGGENLAKSLRVLKPGGKAIGIAGPPDPAFAHEAGLNPLLRLAVTGLSSKIRRQAKKLGVTYEFLFMRASGDQLRQITTLVDKGVLRPVVGRVFGFDQTPEALRSLSEGGIRGKAVITPKTDPPRPRRERKPHRHNPRKEKPTMSTNDTPNEPVITSYANAPARAITAGGVTYAYRELGPKGGIPVVFFVHLAATLDNWDPRIIDPVAKGRHVIAFDQRGVGASSGQVPDSVEAMADDAYTFITALGFDKIDVFSFSLGGMIAQALVVKHPELVRKLVLTGTGPKGGTGIDKVAGTTYWDILRATLTRSDPKEFLFFNRDAAGKTAARAFVNRLKERTADRDAKIKTKAFQTQLKAIKKWGRSTPDDLSAITGPTLIANGDNDRMVPSVLSEDLHRRIKGSELIIYPDSGHGGIFQYHEKFAPVAVQFLTR